MNKFKTLAVAIFLSFMASSSYAIEKRNIYSPSGKPVFQLRFFDVGDEAFSPAGPDSLYSTWNLNEQQKNNIGMGVSYWTEILKTDPDSIPAILNIGTISDDTAFANGGLPLLSDDGLLAATPVYAALSGYLTDEDKDDVHGIIALGRGTMLKYDAVDYIPSQLSRADGPLELSGVVLHEVAHLLGISNYAMDLNGPATPYFTPFLMTWGEGLRDDNGNPARPGQAILCSACNNPYDSEAFDVRNDQGYFTGEHVSEVMVGSLPGIPVKMLKISRDGNSELDTDYMSHSELKNSMMSHQKYRNYTTFMEAELAALQDLGYDIDRRNFFGFSVYGDHQTLVNNNGYFLRNPAGTAYLPGRYNTATQGLGLHVYGSNNTIMQQADLLTKGTGGAGIRVDGGANHILIPAGTRVHADGLNGRGVMFAYGKNHDFTLSGDVQAMGQLGVGVSFDFGNNMMANGTEYRGSYIHSFFGVTKTIPDELNGALVDSFDLTGRVAGKDYAIYMSRNALVNRINIMQGARIEGDIRSDYAQVDEAGNARLTRISFGQRADSNGQAMGQPDAGFNWRYDGNIKGINNIELAPMGGMTSLNGRYEVYGVNVAPSATLSGNAVYTLHPNSTFVNNGTLSPGNSIGRIEINGPFQQGSTGLLFMDVNGAQAHDVLAVSGSAKLDGQLTLVPQRGDWYGQNWGLQASDLVQAGAFEGAFSSVRIELDSPTLSTGIRPLASGNVAFSIYRQANAYSQYAANENAAGAGRALYQLVQADATSTRPLLQVLDFSASDGRVVTQALDQLTPAVYSAMFASSLSREQQIGGIVASRALFGASGGVSSDAWTGFAVPFGGGIWQDQRGSIVGYDSASYGVVLGAEKRSAGNKSWVLGAYGAISHQSVNFDDPYGRKGRTTSFNLGVHTRYARNEHAGFYGFGQAQLGVEDGKLDRDVRFDGYSARHSADWTGWSGSLVAGTGYRWALSERASAGPLVSLAYTHLSRPSLTESGADSSRLSLESSHFNSLRSSIGFILGVGLPSSEERSLRADLEVTWDHELLNKKASLDAHFAGYPQASFTTKNRVAARDSMGVRAGLAYQVSEDMKLAANVSSQFFAKGRNSFSGHLSLNWQF